MPTGVAVSFEFASPTNPSTFNLRGSFVNPNRIEGAVVGITDNANSESPGYNSQVGFVVGTGTFTLDRIQ